MIVGVKPEKRKELYDFMIAMAPIMTVNDRDGLGFAAMSNKGIYTEHWLDPKDAFRFRPKWQGKDEAFKEAFKGVFNVKKTYGIFSEAPGAVQDNPFAVLMHARLATCEVSLENVHPFYREGTALIHNGMISNYKSPHLELITSTCDSETILNSYHKHKVSSDIEAIKKVKNDLTGGYACGVLTKDQNGKEVMDLFRNGPQLHACHVNELDALVICTNKYMVRDAVKDLKWTCGNFYEMQDDTIVRIDARTGDLISTTKFGFQSAPYRTNSDYYGAAEAEKKTPKMKEIEILKKLGNDSTGVNSYLDGGNGTLLKH